MHVHVHVQVYMHGTLDDSLVLRALNVYACECTCTCELGIYIRTSGEKLSIEIIESTCIHMN